MLSVLRGALLLVILAVLTPLVVLASIITITGAHVVQWQPPNIWTTTFGRTDILNTFSGVQALSVDPTGLYAAGFLNRNDTATPPFFVARFDLSGHQVWMQHPQTSGDLLFNYDIKSISVGTDGVYALGYFNVSASIRKYDTNGTQMWTSIFGQGGISPQATTVSTGRAGIYAAGSAFPNQTGVSSMIVSRYDPNGTVIWTNKVGSAYSGRISVYVNDNGLYVASSTYYGPGETEAFVSKYDFDGSLKWSRHLNDLPVDTCSCTPTETSGDSTGIYVAGETAVANGLNDAFLRKFDWSGNQLWKVGFSTPDYSTIVDPRMSADSSGVYLSFSTGAGNNFISKYDANGNSAWSFQIPASEPKESSNGIPLSAGQNGVFVGGSSLASHRTEAYVADFSESSSLILFGVNPPYSFGVIATIPTVVTVGVLWYRRRRDNRVRPSSANTDYASRSRRMNVRAV